MAGAIKRLKELDRENNYCNHLESYKVTVAEISNRNKARYFLLELDPEAKRLNVIGFKSRALREANAAYTSEQQKSLFQQDQQEKKQTVLVSVDDIAHLKRAYPNYYLDTTHFVMRVRNIIS
jgi:hypothetical protein